MSGTHFERDAARERKFQADRTKHVQCIAPLSLVDRALASMNDPIVIAAQDIIQAIELCAARDEDTHSVEMQEAIERVLKEHFMNDGGVGP